jgi:hypothetical protein
VLLRAAIGGWAMVGLFYSQTADTPLQIGEPARDVVGELHAYLACERPRAGEVLVEPCAGYGENPPANLPSEQFPTLWRRDDRRFAIARAVLAVSRDGAARAHALRHLLHAPTPAERIAALETLRSLPHPWTAFADGLAECLGAGERLVVPKALVTLGVGPAVASPAALLRARAARDDKELAALARRLLP